MTRYSPSRNYLTASIAAIAMGAFSAWVAVDWAPAMIPAVLFLLSSAVLLFLARRPPIEVQDRFLVIGRRRIAWPDIRRVDRTGWISPLIVQLTLADRSRIHLIYPGDLDSSNSLLRHLRRCATEALIDGVPHRRFWGEELSTRRGDRRPRPPACRLLREEDEAEVERLYRRLKTVGHLDSTNSDDEM